MMNKLVSLLIITLSYVTISCFLFTCCSCSTTKDNIANVIPYEDDVEASSIFKEFRYVVDNNDINIDITDVDTVITKYDNDDELGRTWKVTTYKLNPAVRGYIEVEEFSDKDDTSIIELNHVLWWLYDTKSNREDIENLIQHDCPAKDNVWITTKDDSKYFTFYKKGIDAFRELDAEKLNTYQKGKLYLVSCNNKIGLYYCTYVD